MTAGTVTDPFPTETDGFQFSNNVIIVYAWLGTKGIKKECVCCGSCILNGDIFVIILWRFGDYFWFRQPFHFQIVEGKSPT